MKTNTILKLEGLLSLPGSIALFTWWFAMSLFLHVADAEDNFQNMILDPQWTAVNLMGLIALILLVLGFPGFYLKNSESQTSLGFFSLLLTCTGLILYDCIHYYETLLWPAAARIHPELVDTGGVLLSGDKGLVAGLVVSGLLLGTGYILFGITTLKNRIFQRVPLWFLIVGAPLFGMGILYPLRTLGLLLFFAGTIWLSLGLRKNRAGQKTIRDGSCFSCIKEI
jgi:hypothetical protein